MPGYLTTHILDTARGCPAQGIRIALDAVSGNAHTKLVEMEATHQRRMAGVMSASAAQLSIVTLRVSKG